MTQLWIYDNVVKAKLERGIDTWFIIVTYRDGKRASYSYPNKSIATLMLNKIQIQGVN